MSENLEDNEPRIIPPAVGNTQNEHVEPLIGTEHAPRVARSVSSDPEESALPSSGAATPVRPAPRRSAPRARRMSLSLHFGSQPVGYESLGSHRVLIQDLATKATAWKSPHEIVVRYGIERGTVPGAQMIQISNRSSRQRTTLARVELPFVAG